MASFKVNCENIEKIVPLFRSSRESMKLQMQITADDDMIEKLLNQLIENYGPDRLIAFIKNDGRL